MKTHGKSKTRLYKIHENIKSRCTNKKNRDYKEYGERGINLFKDWYIFENFEKWALENGYKDNLTIDRKDNDGSYNPNNCRWVKYTVQSRNTRRLKSTNKSGFRGVSFDKPNDKWRARIRVDYKNISILSSFCRVECAIAYDKYVLENKLEHTRNFI